MPPPSLVLTKYCCWIKNRAQNRSKVRTACWFRANAIFIKAIQTIYVILQHTLFSRIPFSSDIGSTPFWSTERLLWTSVTASADNHFRPWQRVFPSCPCYLEPQYVPFYFFAQLHHPSQQSIADLSTIYSQGHQAIQNELNHLSRKFLNFKSPGKVHFKKTLLFSTIQD